MRAIAAEEKLRYSCAKPRRRAALETNENYGLEVLEPRKQELLGVFPVARETVKLAVRIEERHQRISPTVACLISRSGGATFRYL